MFYDIQTAELVAEKLQSILRRAEMYSKSRADILTELQFCVEDLALAIDQAEAETVKEVVSNEWTVLEEVFKVVFNDKTYYPEHGDPFDRGGADSYYGRVFDPHWYPAGSLKGEIRTTEDMSFDEISAYRDGYYHNEQQGNYKEY